MQPQIAPSRAQHALNRIADCLRDCPDTGGGVQLRRVLWSLYNQHHLVNLWTLVSRLDGERRAWVAEVLTAALVGTLREEDLKRALLAAGEMGRWEETQPSDETVCRFEEALDIVTQLVRVLPPCRAHTDLVALLRRFGDVKLEGQVSAPATADQTGQGRPRPKTLG